MIKQAKKVIIALFLGIVMVFGVAGCNAGVQDELQSKIDALQSRIEEMEAQIGERNKTIEDLNDRLAETEEQISEQDERIEQLEKEIAEKTAGAFYTLQEAYDNGWLTQADLMSIAYYHNGGRWHNEEIMSEDYEPLPKTPEVLSNLTELKIKHTAVNEFKMEFPGTPSALIAKVEDFTINEYNGTYNGCIAVRMIDNFTGYWDVVVAPKIAGIRFYYGNTNYIKIWRETK